MTRQPPQVRCGGCRVFSASAGRCRLGLMLLDRGPPARRDIPTEEWYERLFDNDDKHDDPYTSPGAGSAGVEGIGRREGSSRRSGDTTGGAHRTHSHSSARVSASVSVLSFALSASLSHTTPAMIIASQMALVVVKVSSKKTGPRTADPTAPIPAHTA